jgi:hypothetical protein
MSDAIFEKALADYQAMGAAPKEKAIDFTPLVGEPLIDPKIISRARRAREMGFNVTFFTNGIRLNQIDLEALLDANVPRIRISTAPFDRETHERLYRTEGKYDALREGLERLLKLRNARNSSMEIILQFRADRNLAKIVSLPDFQNFILPHLRTEEIGKLYAQVRSFDSWGGQIKSGDLAKGMEIAQAPHLKRRPCLWTFSLQVLFDGKVRACSARFTGQELEKGDALFVGDIAKQTLGEIWESSALRNLRRKFGDGQLPAVCQTCTMYRSV